MASVNKQLSVLRQYFSSNRRTSLKSDYYQVDSSCNFKPNIRFCHKTKKPGSSYDIKCSINADSLLAEE